VVSNSRSKHSPKEEETVTEQKNEAAGQPLRARKETGRPEARARRNKATITDTLVGDTPSTRQAEGRPPSRETRTEEVRGHQDRDDTTPDTEGPRKEDGKRETEEAMRDHLSKRTPRPRRREEANTTTTRTDRRERPDRPRRERRQRGGHPAKKGGVHPNPHNKQTDRQA